jgi:NAD(P)-dependent dehydrogenase (short-subunit alcohol dehydrogenase family)
VTEVDGHVRSRANGRNLVRPLVWESVMGMLASKAIVITGAGRGLGRAYALEAAREGASVVVNDVDATEAEAVVTAIVQGGGRAVAHTESIATWDGARSVIDRSVEAFGKLDGLVNNAGILHAARPHEEQEQPARKAVEVNLLGSIYVGAHAMRVMVGQGHGVIVNNTSSSHYGVPDLATYSATKGALASLTYSWAVDMMPFGVRVNAFSPSAFTRMSTASGSPNALKAPPIERNVPAVIYLLSDQSAGITGQVIQLRVNDLVVVAHPHLTDAFATAEGGWTPQLVTERFDPVLRANIQPLGWAPALTEVAS